MKLSLVRCGASFLFLLTGCTPQSSLPGTSLGTFSTTATLTANTCGASLGAPDPWTFDAVLSKDGSTIYWQQGDSTANSGVLDSSNKVTMTVTSTDASDGGACTMSETDTLVATFDSATSPASASGTIALQFGASSTTDCASALSTNGGSYQTLPCTVSYSFTSKKK